MLGRNPKVRCALLDLSDALEEIPSLQKEVSRCSSLDDCFAKISRFFQEINQKAKTRKNLILKELEPGDRVDYAISSLVSSQLGVKFKVVTFKMFQEKFGEFFTRSLSSEQIQQLSYLICECNALMAQNHIRDICSWVGPRGNIYYADTFKKTPLLPIIPDNAIEEITATLAKRGALTIRHWTWVENLNSSYPVTAMLTQAVDE